VARRSAEVADLRDALTNYLASVTGEGPETSAPARDTPGARAAGAAGADRRRARGGRSRIDSLPEGEQIVIRRAAELLALLRRIEASAPPTPGEESARRSGGTRLDLARGFAA
jgi:hypothetical protein